MEDSNSNFEQYLQHRMSQAGAMTPGQKLELVRELTREAHEEGRVPVAHNTVARLDVKNPAVQAVLRGEEVSLGGTVVKKEGFKGLEDRRVAMGVLIGSMILMIAVVAVGVRMMKPVEPEPTPTVEASPTLEPTQTPQPTQPPPTPIPPTPAPPTPTAAFAAGIGGPAESSRDPASIEFGGRLFIVSKGVVDEKTGIWKPVGPEWLEGTEVRRVFAVPYNEVRDLTVDSGSLVRVRTRGGAVLEYKVSDVARLMANQIETFVSLRPSVVVFVPMEEGGDANASERIAILAEAPLVTNYEETYETTGNPLQGVTNTAVNLRLDPGLKSDIILGLPPNTALAVSDYPPVTMEDIRWVYVAVVDRSGGWVYGWVSADYVSRR